MRLSLAICVIPLLAGCVVTKQTYGPDGRVALSMNCSGIALSWASCYEKAGAVCGARGYDVLAVNGETGAVITANPQGAFGSTVINRTMLVSCKGESPVETPRAKKVVPTGVMPGEPDCQTRVISAGGKPVPPEEQCLPPVN